MRTMLPVLGVAAVVLSSAAGQGLTQPPSTASLQWQFAYDPQGQLTKIVDPGGQATTLQRQFDSQGRIQRVTTTDADGTHVVSTMDRFGHRATMQDALGNVAYIYDGFGRLTTVHRGDQPALHYTYDAHDRVASVAIGTDWRVTYTYDYLGRVAEIGTPVGAITYRYHAASGSIERTFPNGVSTTWKTRPDGTLAAIVHTTPERYVLLRYAYEYRPDGLISAIEETSAGGRRRITYAYDQAQRLTAVEEAGSGRIAYTYDALGNRTESRVEGQAPVPSTYDWAGRLHTHAGAAVRHDASGNLLSLAQDGGPLYTYDAGQRLVSANAGAERITYRYDGDARLVERTVGKATTRFIVDPMADGWQPLAAIGTDHRTYYVWDGNVLVASVDKHGPTFYLHDHLGSVRVALDSSAKPIASVRYDPFGRPLEQPTSALPRAGFASMMYDPVARFYLTPGRPYQPELGRFLQIDPELRTPLGAQEDLALYPYCGNDPVNYVDRSGAARQVAGSSPLDWLVTAGNAAFQAAFERHRGPRRPSVTKGRWEGIPGNGKWFSSDPKVVAITKGEPIVFKNGRPDFSPWVQHEPLTFTPGQLQGTRGDFTLVHEKLANRLGLKNPAAARQWLKNNALTAHHVTETRIDLVPTDLHSVTHAGSASNMRWWDMTHQKMQVSMRQGQSTVYEEPTSLLTEYGTPGVQAAEAALSLGGIALDALATLETFVNETGSALMSAFGETGLQKRDQFHLKAYQDRGVVPGYTGALTRTFADGTVYRRTGSLAIETKGITRIDNVSVTGRGYQYNRNTSIQSRGMNAFANLMQGRYPLAGYDPSDTVIARTSHHTRQHQVVTDGVRRTQGLPLAESQTTFFPGDTSAAGFAAGQPHTVGGIYLRGAAKALAGLGELTGVALDENNGGLVLLSRQGDIALPPLRLDTIVTVFRAVYNHGVAPWVSIDPDSNDPHGPLMHVVHGPETAGTFVGWVLFEADRVMKGYSLGTDNVTRKRMASQIAGYRHLLHRDFVDGEAGGAQRWERFWLAPAAVKRLQSARGRLTLFDVPLKVATEVMLMQNGKLVSASDAGRAGGRAVLSSPGAQTFAQWFTGHYDDIEAEWRSTPPPGSGIEADVNVFFELRRIALIAGIAEKLRDDGVPMPAWMREYKVEPITMDPTTPALHLEDVQQTTRHEAGTQTVTTTTRRIYGGVNLSPADRDVHDVPESAVAAAVVTPFKEATRHGELLRQVDFHTADTHYRAAILPGAASRDIGGLNLKEVDLLVQAPRGGGIALTRTYHSFHTPTTESGEGWTFDLPRLEERRRPTQRTGDMTTFAIGYELTSPLHTWSALFTHEEMVPELGGTFLVPRARGAILAVGRLRGEPGPTVFLRNGHQLHFDARGDLLAIDTAPSKMVYRRDASGRLRRLEHWHGGERLADITLEYDTAGRVTSARGSNGATARYVYDAAGRLWQVLTDAGVTEYASQEGLITAIRRDDQDIARFQYNDRGQLQREWRASGGSTTYTRRTSHDGTTLVIQHRPQDTCPEGETPSQCGAREVVTTSIDYDAGLRPRLHVLSDGSHRAWSEAADGARQLTRSHPDGTQTIMRASADGKRVDITLPEGGQLHIANDDAGRMTELQKAGKLLFRQVWRRDGQLGRREYLGTTVQPEYADGGMMTGLLVGAPTAGSHFDQWTHTTYDSLGRPSELADSSGMKMQIAWHQANDSDYPAEPTTTITNRGQISITQGDDGRVTEIATSWGTRVRREHNGPDGTLSRIHLHSGNDQATVDLDSGRVTRIQQFDGGTYAFDYHEKHVSQLARISVPGNVELRYDYDEKDRLSSVGVGGIYRITYKYDDENRISEITRAPIAH